MRKWNPYNIEITSDWVREFAEKERIPQWYAKYCLHVGLFFTNVEHFITGK